MLSLNCFCYLALEKKKKKCISEYELIDHLTLIVVAMVL